jgi:spore coat polysaccharide biosynthesis protein SpsF
MAVVVIQARLGSTRLPGKVLRPLGGRPVLSWVIRAALEARVGEVVVATTEMKEDDEVAACASRHGAAVVRGAVDDVLGRFLAALVHRDDGETVVRLTADCPLLDPVLIRQAVVAYEAGSVDYLSTVLEPSLPRGFDVEVTSVGTLRAIDGEAEGFDRAHVTSLLYRQPSDRVIAGLVYRPSAADLRVTLDTPEDAALLDALVAHLGDRTSPWLDVVALLRARPDIVALNEGVTQKRLEDG